MRRSKRGTEKPIEIFVALFVILAVALVMLKLFQSQITEKQKQLTDFQQEQKSKEMLNDVQLHCQNKCTEASNNGCSLQALAGVCIAGSHQVLDSNEFLDFDGDNFVGYNIEYFGGEGVCEDQVYCFSLIDSCCARKITVETCSDILSQYWDSKGWKTDSAAAAPASEAQRCSLCHYKNGVLNRGGCTGDELAWWESTGFSVCEHSDSWDGSAEDASECPSP